MLFFIRFLGFGGGIGVGEGVFELCLGCLNERVCLWGDLLKFEVRKCEIVDLGMNMFKVVCFVNIRFVRCMKRLRSLWYYVYFI